MSIKFSWQRIMIILEGYGDSRDLKITTRDKFPVPAAIDELLDAIDELT